MTTQNQSTLITSINAGLTGTFSTLANYYPSGLTLSNLSTAMTNSSISSSLNPTFASYIQSNFSTMDKDNDGIISATEMSTFTNKISTQGVTSAQLSQLGSASGMSSQALSQVLEHFNDIDTNHDGKVSSAEIAAFKLKSAEEKKKTEFSNKAATDMSMFYGNDDATVDSSSLVDFKYMQDGSSGSTNSTSS